MNNSDEADEDGEEDKNKEGEEGNVGEEGMAVEEKWNAYGCSVLPGSVPRSLSRYEPTEPPYSLNVLTSAPSARSFALQI